MPDYSKEQLWGLYKELPKDLQKATFSEEVGQNIQDICKKNNITNNDIVFNITKNIGYIFLGLLSPNKFSRILEEELKLEKDKAEQITSELTNSVFMPVKKSLEALYEIKITAKLKEKKEALKRKDVYREVVE